MKHTLGFFGRLFARIAAEIFDIIRTLFGTSWQTSLVVIVFGMLNALLIVLSNPDIFIPIFTSLMLIEEQAVLFTTGIGVGMAIGGAVVIFMIGARHATRYVWSYAKVKLGTV